MEIRFYHIQDWRDKHPNDLNTRVGIENVPSKISKVVFETITNKKGVKEIKVK